MPTTPVPYHHLLRGPLARAWRPLVSLLFVLLGWLAVTIGVSVVLAGYLLASSGPDPDRTLTDFGEPIVFGLNNLVIAAFTPIATLSIWAVHRVRPGFVSSVVGRLRWAWLVLCTVVLLPLWIAYILVTESLDGPTPELAPEPGWAVMLVLVLLTTPLQSAGEEYLFRGWVMQNIGAWIRRPNLALWASIVVSATVFALAHTSFDVWILLDLGIFATAAVVLTWRTGGLEAAIVMHAVNNVVAMSFAVGTGDIGDVLITETTTGSPQQLVYSIIVQAIAVPLVLLLARWRGIQRTYQPRPPAPPQGPPHWNCAPHIPGGYAPGYPGRAWDSRPGQAPGMPGTSPWGT